MTSKLKVLIVDDDVDACTSLRRILSLDGIDVDIANEARDLFRKSNWSDYFAILLDRRLPDGTAEELLPIIKEKAPQAAIVIITGYADMESSITAFRAGAEDYIVKPINPDSLRATLDRIGRVRRAEERSRQVERLAVIGQVVASVAHECRNFLQLMCSAVELLKISEQDNPESIHGIAIIERAEQGLERLLEELRQFAAPIELDKVPQSLQSVWQNAWKDIATTSNIGNARMDEVIGDIGLRCQIDAFRMGQVFKNLFTNSIEACGDDACLQVHCEYGDETLKVSVQDNGPGLTIEQRENVFRPFFTTKTKGTGLGMAIVKRIIEAHGGDICVGDCSEGAEFIISLPIGNV